MAAGGERVLQLMLHSTMRHVLQCGCERHLLFQEMYCSNMESVGFGCGKELEAYALILPLRHVLRCGCERHLLFQEMDCSNEGMGDKY